MDNCDTYTKPDFEVLVYEIIRWFKTEKGIDEPLDGDDVDSLMQMIRDKINDIEGNW